MFDFVPLARSRREMADRNGQPRVIRQLLQFQFPEPQPGAIAATAIGRDEQLPRLGIQLAAFRSPPTANRRDGESPGVVVGPHVHESRVTVHVIGPPRHLAYNSPFVPGFLKIGEVQLPVERDAEAR